MGRLFYHVIGSVAEFEREMIIERVRGVWPTRVRRANHLVARKTELPSCASSPCAKQGLSLREIARREERRAALSGGPECRDLVLPHLR